MGVDSLTIPRLIEQTVDYHTFLYTSLMKSILQMEQGPFSVNMHRALEVLQHLTDSFQPESHVQMGLRLSTKITYLGVEQNCGRNCKSGPKKLQKCEKKKTPPFSCDHKRRPQSSGCDVHLNVTAAPAQGETLAAAKN